MQREAADKFCGARRGYLYAALLAPWFEASIIHHFQRSDFTPSPRVDVVMLRLNKRGPPLIVSHERQLYRDFVVHAFVTRQPTLSHTLKAMLSHQQLRQMTRTLGIDLCVPPSTLTTQQWIQLFHHFSQIGSPQARRLISGSERRLRQQQAKLHKVHRTRAAQARSG